MHSKKVYIHQEKSNKISHVHILSSKYVLKISIKYFSS